MVCAESVAGLHAYYSKGPRQVCQPSGRCVTTSSEDRAQYNLYGAWSSTECLSCDKTMDEDDAIGLCTGSVANAFCATTTLSGCESASLFSVGVLRTYVTTVWYVLRPECLH